MTLHQSSSEAGSPIARHDDATHGASPRDLWTRSFDRLQNELVQSLEDPSATCGDSSSESNRGFRHARHDAERDAIRILAAQFSSPWAVPLLPNGAPDRERLVRLTELMTAVDSEGQSYVVMRGLDAPRCAGPWLVAGVDECGAMRCGECWLPGAADYSGDGEHVRRRKSEAQIARTLAPAEASLTSKNLSPRIDPASGRLVAPIAPQVAAMWETLGVIERCVIDRTLACPECGAVVTARRGCRNCGSAFPSNQTLIHHFACAFVAPSGRFDSDGELVCPKCRTRGMIVGADFEYIPGPYECPECDWSDTELAMIAQCCGCGVRFPLEEADERDVVTYKIRSLFDSSVR